MERIWFERWVIEGYSIRQLSEQSGHSQARIRRIINHWISLAPEKEAGSLEEVDHVIFDGTFLHRPVSIVALMDAKTNAIISGEYDVRENSDMQLTVFLSPLKERGLSPLSCTTDGNPQAMRVLKTMWPDTVIQRCLVHIQRQGIKWCRAYPKTGYARKLRDVFKDVTYIYTKEDRDSFLSKLSAWEDKYGEYVAEKQERGRVFSDIKRARTMLLKALPDMFHYLDIPGIPSSTNGLEGYFSRLKGHYRHHRGLKPEKRHAYFDWYFKLRPR